MSDWVAKPLGDILTLQRGHDLPAKSRVGGDVPIIGSAGLTGYHNEVKSKGPGVVVGRSGNSMGEVHFTSKDYWPLNTALFVKDFKGNDERFIYYLLKTINFDQFNSGSAQKSLNRNAVYPFVVNIPDSVEEQQRIAKILSDLEGKIALNRQINQTLEHIAQAIFKSWFIDFDPVKAKIEAKQIGRARHDGERSESQRKIPNVSSDATWPEAQAGAGAEGDPERAAMCAISGKTDAELDAFLEASTPEQRQQLTATAALFPDELEESELGPIPKGGSWKPLEKVIELNPKRILKKGELAKYLDMKNMPTQGHLAEDYWKREMGSGTKFINGDTLLTRITPCLENGKTAFVNFLNEGEVGWGSTEYIVMRSKDPLPVEYTYLLARESTFRAFAIQNMTGTSGRQRVNANALSEYPLAISHDEGLYREFTRIVSSAMAQSKKLGDQGKTLSSIRDAILPKLLSGEVVHGKAQIRTEAIA